MLFSDVREIDACDHDYGTLTLEKSPQQPHLLLSKKMWLLLWILSYSVDIISSSLTHSCCYLCEWVKEFGHFKFKQLSSKTYKRVVPQTV